MKFKELTLFTNELAKQKHFYSVVLGFELIEDQKKEFSLKIGWSKLRFVETEVNYTYHYCFLIPSNQLHASLEWLSNRTKTIEISPGEKIVNFEDWNADAFYFLDGSGNIAEFIVRYDLKNEVNADFNCNSILGLNEIGIATKDISSINKQLQDSIGTKLYKGDLIRFGTNGSAEGIFLLPNYALKDTWFPTVIKIKPEPFEAIVENNSNQFSVVYRNEKLFIQPII